MCNCEFQIPDGTKMININILSSDCEILDVSVYFKEGRDDALHEAAQRMRSAVLAGESWAAHCNKTYHRGPLLAACLLRVWLGGHQLSLSLFIHIYIALLFCYHFAICLPMI